MHVTHLRLQEPTRHGITICAGKGGDHADGMQLRDGKQTERIEGGHEALDDLAMRIQKLQLPAPFCMPCLGETEDVGDAPFAARIGIIVSRQEVPGTKPCRARVHEFETGVLRQLTYRCDGLCRCEKVREAGQHGVVVYTLLWVRRDEPLFVRKPKCVANPCVSAAEELSFTFDAPRLPGCEGDHLPPFGIQSDQHPIFRGFELVQQQLRPVISQEPRHLDAAATLQRLGDRRGADLIRDAE